MKDLKMSQYKRMSIELGVGKATVKCFVVLRSFASILMFWLHSLKSKVSERSMHARCGLFRNDTELRTVGPSNNIPILSEKKASTMFTCTQAAQEMK